MYKAYKFRLCLDENQKTLINKNTQYARFIYNFILSDRKNVEEISSALRE